MKRKIKLLVVGLLLIFAVACLKADQEPVTINVWDWWVNQSVFLDNEIKLFQEKNPSIKIKRTKQATARYKELVNLAQRSGNLPDILAIPVEVRVEWIQNGYFRSLSPWINPEFVNRFPKGSFMPGVNMYNGQYYSFPLQGVEYWCQLYINNAVFRKAGLVDKSNNILIPKTWNEVREYAKIITQKGNGQFYGMGFSYKPEHLHANMFYEWARAAGARGGNQELHMGVDYKVGKYNFTSPDVLPAYLQMFNLFIAMMNKDKSMYPSSMSIEDETLRSNFADGKIGMIMGGYWNMLGWRQTHPNFTDYECVMIPPPDNKGYRALCPIILATAYYGMSGTVKHPEEAWKFLDWLAHPEVGTRYVKTGLGISIFPSANIIANAQTRQFGQYMELSSKYAKPGPNPFARNPQLANVDVKPVMPNHIGVFWGIISGQIKESEIPKALNDLEDRLNKALDEGFAAAIKKGYSVKKGDLAFPDWNPLEPYEQK